MAAFAAHPRNWRQNRYVYPVCSRRAGGLSIGINLSLDRRCTFNCVYCQVNRTTPPPPNTHVDLDAVRAELTDMLDAARTGRLLAEPEFAALPAPLRRLNDVAFSGDGEPTGFERFSEAVELADDAIATAGVDAKLVLITNGTLLHLDRVRRGLLALHRHRGEVWAKLDAGTESAYQRIERSTVPFARVLANLAWAAKAHGIVVQSCFMRLDGQGPSAEDVDAYCDRLADILSAGGRIVRVQVYTVARQPVEAFVSPLSRDEVDAIVARVSARLPNLLAQPFYGPG